MGSRFATLVVLALIAATGCARGANPQPQTATPAMRPPSPPAVALCFAPAVADELASADLAREGRETEAFVGYSLGQSEYYVTRTNDRQLYTSGGRFGRFGGWGGSSDFSHYDRQAYSERSGVLVR